MEQWKCPQLGGEVTTSVPLEGAAKAWKEAQAQAGRAGPQRPKPPWPPTCESSRWAMRSAQPATASTVCAHREAHWTEAGPLSQPLPLPRHSGGVWSKPKDKPSTRYTPGVLPKVVGPRQGNHQGRRPTPGLHKSSSGLGREQPISGWKPSVPQVAGPGQALLAAGSSLPAGLGFRHGPCLLGS